MKIKILLAAALAVLVAATAAPAAAPSETVLLRPVAKSKVSGSATLGPKRAGTGVTVRLSGLAPRAQVRVLLRAGRWPRVSASFATAATALADARGSVAVRGEVQYVGRPVAWSVVSDGDHSLTVVVGGRVVAVGAIPGMD